MSVSLRQAAAALGGEVCGQRIMCPGPGHSPRDRSLVVLFSPDAPEGFLTKSFAADDWKLCRDHVRDRLRLPPWEPGDERKRTVPPSKVDVWDMVHANADAADFSRREGDAERIERALRVWDGGCDPRGTVVERYLASRGLDLPDDISGNVLRFHYACPWRNESTGQTDRIPALIAAFRAIDGDAVTGVHRIRLDQHERWPKAERPVKLDQPANGKLVIGEGVETCMAARKMGYAPTWALCSVGMIATFPVLDVAHLTILGETGAASQSAVRWCGRRYREAGKRGRVVMPSIGSDMNDELIGGAI